MNNDSNYENELREIRKNIFKIGYESGVLFFASCFSCVEILYALYAKGALSFDSKDSARDRFVMSKGQGAAALYSVLAQAGLISKEELFSFNKPNSLISFEPRVGDNKCFTAMSCSLGRGLSTAVGVALAMKMNNEKGRVFVLIGDGECQEGAVWEAAVSAAAMKLDNLVLIEDCNGLQKTGTVEEIMGVVNWREKWLSFGWDVEEADGHNVDEMFAVLKKPNATGKPRLIIAHTVKGKGVSIMENQPRWHSRQPNKKELQIIKKELCIGDSELE